MYQSLNYLEYLEFISCNVFFIIFDEKRNRLNLKVGLVSCVFFFK